MKKVVISGAGLVGSFLAVMMKKRGYEVDLFEKRSDMRLDSSSAGRSINLIATSRSLNAFKNEGLLEDILKITVPVTGRMMHSRDGELTYQPYGRNESECNYSVSRSLLNKHLISEAEKAGANIYFEKSLTKLDAESNICTFEDHELKFDLFFGADGAGSQTRKELLRLMPSESDTTEFIGSDYKELFMPANENGDYPIEKKALHIWPRGHHMFMALPNLDGSFTMTAYLPKVGEDSFELLKTNKDVRAFFEKEYGDSVSLMPGFEDEFFENPQGRLGTVRMSRWNYKGKIALVGDAAHAIVPFFGQGMNCGIEDCSVLACLMDKHGENFETIFNEYDKWQRPNGNAIADMALENFIEMQSKVGNEKFLLKKKIEQVIEEKFPNLYRARYGMVTYTLIPYAIAQKAGLIQQEILDELSSDISDIKDLDINLAKKLLDEKFVPFLKEFDVSLDRFTLL